MSRRPAVLVAAALMALALAGCGRGTADGDPLAKRPSSSSGPTRQVVSYGVAVDVPRGWRFDYSASRPDCITRDGHYAGDPWTHGVPRAPYVQVGLLNRAVPDIACFPKLPAGLPKAFGALPFDLWEPYVEIDRRDLAQGADGLWRYRHWTLTRKTVGRAAIAVLAPPASPDLGAQVLASAHTVGRDPNGCTTRAPRQLTGSRRPPYDGVPAARTVDAIDVCAYDRTVHGRPLMAGSRRLSGKAARSLTAAILAAPSGGGPDRPRDCQTSMHGDQALVLHFVVAGASTPSDPQAYVYSDWCVGNGIFTADGPKMLTRADCRPLYDKPPVLLWSTQGNVAPLCWPA